MFIMLHKQDIIQSVKMLIVAVVVLIGANALYAWTSPASNPPGGNTPAPLNVGPVAQAKSGNLKVGSASSAPTQALEVVGNAIIGNNAYILSRVYAPTFYDQDNTNYYLDPSGVSVFNAINLGGVTRNTWPTGGTLSVTTVTQGPIFGAGTLSATAVCPADRVVVGGGFSTSGSANNNAVLFNAPSGNGWRVDVENNTTASFGLTVYARCAKIVQ